MPVSSEKHLPHEGGPAELAQWAADHTARPYTVSLSATSGMPGVPSSISIAMVPGADGDWEMKSLKPFFDEFRTNPSARSGVARLGDLASFIAHANRFKSSNSVLFADPERSAPSLQAVLDYHDPVNAVVTDREFEEVDVPKGDTPIPLPRFGKHRSSYAFPLSDEWRAWKAGDGKPMGPEAFAEFLEDRIADVVLMSAEPGSAEEQLAATLGGMFASPSRLLELSRGLKIHVDHKYQGAKNLSTGETQFQWTEEHRDEAGAPLVVPNLFAIAIPVFKGADRFRLSVRLRYRLGNGKVVWFYQIYRADETFDAAFFEACEMARVKTGLPLFTGTPEPTS